MMPDPSNTQEKPVPTLALWSAVWAMSLCCAVLIASEFLPVSLLTPIAADLHIREGQVGQAIAISGIFAVLTSLTISRITQNLNRRHVILGLTLLMIISGLMVSMATNATLFMLGRAMLGIVIGGFWAMSTAIVMRLVPREALPRALGLLNGGNALATTIAAPLGSFLGGVIGWRETFFCIVPIGIVTLYWQFKSIPSLPPLARTETTQYLWHLLKRPRILWGMLAILALFMGQFALFTYLRPYLENVTRVDTHTLSLLLLVLGVAGLAGTLLISHLLQRHVYPYLLLIPFSMAILALGFTGLGQHLWWVAALLGLWGLIGTSAPVVWNTWLTQSLAAHEVEQGGGLMVAVIQLAITLGATLGGFLFDLQGYQATFVLSSFILLLSATCACLTWHQH